MNNICIKTELGYLKGRDALYIDYFNQDGNVININGEINGKLCSKFKNDSWYKYELIFNNVLIYESQHIDICRWETETSFDEILGEDEFNNYLVNKKLYRGFVLSSYSYIYKIFASNYSLKIIENI